MTPDPVQDVTAYLHALRGQRCWYVSCGGAAGTTFQLALGDKVRRERVLRNAAHSEEFRHFEGEYNLLVWCTWRLDGPDGPLTSSDDTAEHLVEGLARLRGAKVRAASAAPPGWDLLVSFWNGLRLRVFCDHVPGDPSFDSNWELWQRDGALIIAPGSRVEFAARDGVPAAQGKSSAE